MTTVAESVGTVQMHHTLFADAVTQVSAIWAASSALLDHVSTRPSGSGRRTGQKNVSCWRFWARNKIFEVD
jgi:hypothetical protein